MSLAADLLEQAEHLCRREARRPRQASLRRAISAAYYSVFHLLVASGAQHLVGQKSATSELRRSLARAYQHTAMRDVARQFAADDPSPKVRLALSATLPPDLRVVDQAFVDLQEARHAADYDVGIGVRRTEVREIIVTANKAHRAWNRVKKHPDARVFLVALLAQKHIQG